MLDESSYMFHSERTMRIPVCRIVTIGAVLILSFWASLTFAQNPDPTTMYLKFVDDAKKASSFDQIAPYLTTNFQKALEAQPQEKTAEWFKYFKTSVNLTDIKVTKQTISRDRCVLEATAKTTDGKLSKGVISLRIENGVWKFNDHGWATEQGGTKKAPRKK